MNGCTVTFFGDNPVLSKCSHLVFVLAATVALAACARSGHALESRLLRAGDDDYRVVDIDLAHDTLELHWLGPDGRAIGSIEALRAAGDAQGRRLRFAANAGIYDQEFRPLGLHIEAGRTLRPLNTARGPARAGNFSIQPNGVFYVDAGGDAGVMTTSAWGERRIQARLATQSGPMLVVDGAVNPNFDSASDSLKWRSGVCAKAPRHVVFAVSVAPVTFHAFARLFRDEFGCRDALYLDGSLSRIYTDEAGYSGAPAIMVKPYAGMFAVFADDSAPR